MCNLCGGIVRYTSNEEVYGRKYGSGFCYLCTQCGAYVGTHKPYPEVALGILANDEMRRAKIICHNAFDAMWRGKKHAQSKRNRAYEELARALKIDAEQCHFGYFDIPMLRRAYVAVKQMKKLRGMT